MNEIMSCHLCGAETDFECEVCKQPVCEDCCVPFTYLNQIDFAMCRECQNESDLRRSQQAEKELDCAEKAEVEKEKRRQAQRKAYRSPEAVEKRRVAKIEKDRLRCERELKRVEVVAKIFNNLFKDM